MKNLFLLAAGLTLLGACKDKTVAPAPQRIDLLTAKNWRISANSTTTTTSAGVSTTTDEYATSPACERDNFYKFNADKTSLRDEGASKCDPVLPQTENFTWAFNADQTQLLVTTPGSNKLETDDIVELSATTLRLRTVTTTSSGTVNTNNVTLTSY